MTHTMSTPLHPDIEHSVVKKEKFGRESIQKTEEIHEVDRQDNIEQLIRQNENVKNQINIWQSSQPMPLRGNAYTMAATCIAILLTIDNLATIAHLYKQL